MKISFERNTDLSNNNIIPYYMYVEIGASELDWERTFKIPVILSHGISYVVEACGRQVQADTLRELGPLAQSLLLSLEHMSRFPTYVFITRLSRKMYPVYTIGDKVAAVTPQGIVFRHVELAKVREYLTDYLQQTGVLGPVDLGDRLHVRGVDKDRLSLIRPTFYLKKRAIETKEHEFWAPVFHSQIDNTIYAYAASTKHEAKIENGLEVFKLRHRVAEALIADKRLTKNYNLRADRLMPDHWVQVRTNLIPVPRTIIYDGIKLPLYRGDNFFVALEFRSTEDRYSLFLENSENELRQRISRDLIRRGYIDDPNAVQIKDS